MGVYWLAVFSSEIPQMELVLRDYGNPLAVGIILYKLCRVIYPLQIIYSMSKFILSYPNQMSVLMAETPVIRMSANSG